MQNVFCQYISTKQFTSVVCYWIVNPRSHWSLIYKSNAWKQSEVETFSFTVTSRKIFILSQNEVAAVQQVKKLFIRNQSTLKVLGSNFIVQLLKTCYLYLTSRKTVLLAVSYIFLKNVRMWDFTESEHKSCKFLLAGPVW